MTEGSALGEGCKPGFAHDLELGDDDEATITRHDDISR